MSKLLKFNQMEQMQRSDYLTQGEIMLQNPELLDYGVIEGAERITAEGAAQQPSILEVSPLMLNSELVGMFFRFRGDQEFAKQLASRIVGEAVVNHVITNEEYYGRVINQQHQQDEHRSMMNLASKKKNKAGRSARDTLDLAA